MPAERERSRAWVRFRREFLRGEPLCRACAAEGLSVAADELDHVVPLHRGGGMWDRENVQPLCRDCHAAKTRRERGRDATLEDGSLEGVRWCPERQDWIRE